MPVNRKFGLYAIISAVSVLIYALGAGCSENQKAEKPISLADAIYAPQGFIILPFDSLPNMRINKEGAETYSHPLDVDSIEMFAYRGGRYYHPTALSRKCQELIATYRFYQDKKYLYRAEHYARKLMSLCVLDGDAAYAALTFSYAVHGDSSLFFEPPWFSAMSQGELLMVVV